MVLCEENSSTRYLKPHQGNLFFKTEGVFDFQDFLAVTAKTLVGLDFT